MATTHNLNNIVIDRVLRGIYSTDADGILFSINQVQNLSLNCTSESQEVVDALGVSIMEFMRSKSVEASAENAIFDLGLMAQQFGTKVKSAGTDEAIVIPVMKTFVIGTDATTTEIEVTDKDGASTKKNVFQYTLEKMPMADITEIYSLNNDSTLGKKYSAAEDEFTYANGVIQFPESTEEGTEMFVMYDYSATSDVVQVVNSANNFPTMGKMTFECLVYDVCDPETKLYAYVILPRFQLKSDFDWTVGGDSQTHPFSGKAHVSYCSKDKEMVRVIIVDDDDE
jgi:hypothetical protein